MTNENHTTRPALDGHRVTMSTTVPAWLDRVIEEMAAAQLVSKSVFIRQMLLQHVREAKAAEVAGD